MSRICVRIRTGKEVDMAVEVPDSNSSCGRLNSLSHRSARDDIHAAWSEVHCLDPFLPLHKTFKSSLILCDLFFVICSTILAIFRPLSRASNPSASELLHSPSDNKYIFEQHLSPLTTITMTSPSSLCSNSTCTTDSLSSICSHSGATPSYITTFIPRSSCIHPSLRLPRPPHLRSSPILLLHRLPRQKSNYHPQPNGTPIAFRSRPSLSANQHLVPPHQRVRQSRSCRTRCAPLFRQVCGRRGVDCYH
jgi:hypothetical protein